MRFTGCCMILETMRKILHKLWCVCIRILISAGVTNYKLTTRYFVPCNYIPSNLFFFPIAHNKKILFYKAYCILEEWENVSYFCFTGARNQDFFANWPPPLWVFSEALGFVFVYIDSLSLVALLRMHNHDFLFSVLHTTHFSIITLSINFYLNVCSLLLLEIYHKESQISWTFFPKFELLNNHNGIRLLHV